MVYGVMGGWLRVGEIVVELLLCSLEFVWLWEVYEVGCWFE